jgi:hypothetical protein
MNIRIFSVSTSVLFLLSLLLACKLFQGTNQTSPNRSDRGHYRLMFYNVENLFDTKDEPDKQDDEFLPDGDRFWTRDRLNDKLTSLYKAIAATGMWEPPEIIGMCEVENREVLQLLIRQTPLGQFPYRIVHRDSPDRRGIDVALMIRTDKVSVLDSTFHQLVFPPDTSSATREIVYAKTLILTDTLHVFANHWPSRLGEAEAERNRFLAGQYLRSLTDSILDVNPLAKIVIMGDFNDEPGDRSLTEGLGAFLDTLSSHGKLYNMMSGFYPASGFGTIKYREQWSVFDQFIVSRSLLDNQGGLYTGPGFAGILREEFLLEPDERYGGSRPFRSYDGFRYRGGFSDHLPVLLDLWFRVNY